MSKTPDSDRSSATATPVDPKTDSKKPEKTTDIYHVKGPGSIMRSREAKGPDGKLIFQTQTLRPGDLVELTAEEAEALGDAVAQGEAPPPDVPEKRTAGRYRLEGPGSWMITEKPPENDPNRTRSRIVRPGEVVSLTADQAQKYTGTLTKVA